MIKISILRNKLIGKVYFSVRLVSLIRIQLLLIYFLHLNPLGIRDR